MQENRPAEASLRQGCCSQSGARAAGDCHGGHCGREMEEQKRMHLVIEWVSLEQKALQSAKHAVPLAQTIIPVYQNSTILTGTIKWTIQLHRDSPYRGFKEHGLLWNLVAKAKTSHENKENSITYN